MKFYNIIDGQKNAFNNFVLQALASDPASPVTGQVYWNTSLGMPQYYTGSAWTNLAANASLFNGNNAAFYLSRANHTGTQTASTISDLTSTVQAFRLDQFAAPTAAVSFNSQRITNLADPTGAQDAATKNYVDTQVSSAAAGIDSKPSVKAIATANVTLSGTQTIDGVSLVATDRVLLTGQTTASQNGVYVVAAGAWSRAVDADATGEITPGATWYIEQGTTYGGTTWRCANTGTITLGSTSITITQLTGGISYSASLGVQLVGSDFRAQVVALGGISAVAGGLQADRTKIPFLYATTIGGSTSMAVTHNLGTQDVIVQVQLLSTREAILMDWVATDANTVTFTPAVAPAASSIRVIIHG